MKAEEEFLVLTARYGKCLLPPLRYITSRNIKRKALCKIVDKLSGEALSLCVPHIINTINMGESVCKEYRHSSSQVDGILQWLPRMSEYREVLLEEVRSHRENYGLKV